MEEGWNFKEANMLSNPHSYHISSYQEDSLLSFQAIIGCDSVSHRETKILLRPKTTLNKVTESGWKFVDGYLKLLPKF